MSWCYLHHHFSHKKNNPRGRGKAKEKCERGRRRGWREEERGKKKEGRGRRRDWSKEERGKEEAERKEGGKRETKEGKKIRTVPTTVAEI